MTRSRDRGSSVIEFIVVGVVVLIPIIYGAECVAAVHAAELATGEAARAAARAFATAPTPPQGATAAKAAVRIAFADQGIPITGDELQLSCAGECLVPGSAVVAQVGFVATLPWLPDSVGVPVHATQRLPIDDYRSSPS